jgi:S1-C subfamily serine protease
MSYSLAGYSDAVARVVAAAAPLICAIRTGPNRHITGLICQADLIVTIDQALPALDSYTVVHADRTMMEARPSLRDPGANLALLRLDTPRSVPPPEIAGTFIGSLAIVVGADADGSPTARLTIVHRFARIGADMMPILDMPSAAEPGSLVLDASGRLIGLAAESASRDPIAVPSDTISRMLMPHLGGTITAPPPPQSDRRGWLGVSLQPISVPEALIGKSGQVSGRMVVHLSRGGPAEKAGIKIGDVLLSLDGTSASGPLAMRAFLSPDRIGASVEVRLLREGQIMTTNLIVGSQRE